MFFMCIIGIPENKDSTSLVIDGKLHLPFQLQIKYTDPDGSQCMRINTMAKPVTADKSSADRGEKGACSVFSYSDLVFDSNCDTMNTVITESLQQHLKSVKV